MGGRERRGRGGAGREERGQARLETDSSQVHSVQKFKGMDISHTVRSKHIHTPKIHTDDLTRFLIMANQHDTLTAGQFCLLYIDGWEHVLEEYLRIQQP